MNTPAASRFRVAFDRAAASHKRSGPTPGADDDTVASTGGKRLRGSDGSAGRHGLTVGRRLG